MSRAPSAQLRPTASGRACRTEPQNASVTCPDRVRPDASVIVPEMMTGQRRPCSSKSVSTAKIAAFALSVSKIVSIISRSLPPSTSPRAASRYAVASWSNETLRAPGSLTSGEIEAVRVVGPRAPATQRGWSSVATASAASRASRADSRLSS